MPSDISDFPSASFAPATPALAWRQRLGLLLMFASGFAGLAYQIVWTQQCAVWLGHETAAVLAVVAAFFGGLALGALALGERIARSAQPVRWYASCEAVIAVWSIALAFLIGPLGGLLLELTGAQPAPAWEWTVAFCGTFLLLLPATLAMGATLPAMERVLSQMRTGSREQFSIAALYASNTFGAVVGVLASAFWLIPAFGLVRTTALCAVMNMSCAAAALYLRSGNATDAAPVNEAKQPASRKLVAMLTATGLLGIGYEVLVVRVLSQVAEDTVYTFAMLLAVYLCGTALGAAIYQRGLSRSQKSAADMSGARDRLLALLAIASLVAMLGLWCAEMLKASALELFGPGMSAALGAEALLALMAFGLPTIAMGALFSHLTTQARASGISFGRALAFNTLGAALAPLLFGVLLVPAVGPKPALLVVIAGYLLLSSFRAWRKPVVWMPAAFALVLAIWAPPLAFVDVPEGGNIVSYQDGAMSSVSVVEDAQGVMRLRIDNRQQEGSSDSRLADARQALLPLLLHPSPKHALFLGLGTGVTAFSAAEDPTLKVDAVELLPEVIAASSYFTRPLLTKSQPSPVHTITADARHYVRASTQQYDVIVSDNFHPARSGSAALYTVEHFRAVQQRLAPGGLFCQWLPLHQLHLYTLRAIVKAFVTAYPDGQAILATNSLETPTIGLVGSDGGSAQRRRFDVAQVKQRLATAAWPQKPAAFGFNDEFAVLGSFIAGPASLAHFAEGARANTDDHPVVAYMAPRITYAPDSLPRDRLVELLAELSTAPTEVLRTADAATQQRLAAYWAARNRYIEIGRNVQPTYDVQQMLAQVREPLLSVLRTSPDFRPAYDPLLKMATGLARVDVSAARNLLIELARLQPARPEASQALGQMGATSP